MYGKLMSMIKTNLISMLRFALPLLDEMKDTPIKAAEPTKDKNDIM